MRNKVIVDAKKEKKSSQADTPKKANCRSRQRQKKTYARCPGYRRKDYHRTRNGEEGSPANEQKRYCQAVGGRSRVSPGREKANTRGREEVGN